MATLVDSNVLVDILLQDDEWHGWSASTLAMCAERGGIVINPLIYAEVSVAYDTIEALERALPADYYVREPLPWEAAFVAGKAYVTYRRRRGPRRSPLPDFYIGAHAAVAGHTLLTRGSRSLPLVLPETPHPRALAVTRRSP